MLHLKESDVILLMYNHSCACNKNVNGRLTHIKGSSRVTRCLGLTSQACLFARHPHNRHRLSMCTKHDTSQKMRFALNPLVRVKFVLLLILAKTKMKRKEKTFRCLFVFVSAPSVGSLFLSFVSVTFSTKPHFEDVMSL
jgi:hypothetical protein